MLSVIYWFRAQVTLTKQGDNYMKKHIYLVLTAVLSTVSTFAQTELLCEVRINSYGESVGKVVLESVATDDGRVFLESQLKGYNIKVKELASKDQTNPTLRLSIKNDSGIILETMTPSPGPSSGEAFILTQLSTPIGIMKVKCIDKSQH